MTRGEVIFIGASAPQVLVGVSIAEAGAIPPLVAMLARPSLPAQETASCALAVLARSETDRPLIAKDGAIPPLVKLLSGNQGVFQAEAAEGDWKDLYSFLKANANANNLPL